MCKNVALENIITLHTLIETKHKNDNDWVITVILNSFGNFIEVKQVNDYLSKVLMIGDQILCRYVCEEYVYLLEVEVYNIKFATRSVVFKVGDIKTIKNTRKHKRYEVYISSSYCKDGTIGECYSVVVNASASGLTIIAGGDLNLDEQVDLSIYLPGFNFISARCIVKWHDKVENNNSYGLQIVDLDEISRYQYDNFIRKLRRKERVLRKKGGKLL